jgi:hypothetical protein
VDKVTSGKGCEAKVGTRRTIPAKKAPAGEPNWPEIRLLNLGAGTLIDGQDRECSINGGGYPLGCPVNVASQIALPAMIIAAPQLASRVGQLEQLPPRGSDTLSAFRRDLVAAREPL